MAQFLAMGGYAEWVWSAYGVAVLVLAGNVIAAGRRYRHAVRHVRGGREHVQESVR